MEYEAYEAMALKAFKDICNELRGRWPAVHGIAIYHRYNYTFVYLISNDNLL